MGRTFSKLAVVPAALAVLAALQCAEDTVPNVPDETVPEGDALVCIADAECGDGKRCQLGVCVDASCKRDSDCPSKSCDLLRGVCNPPADSGPGTSTDGGGTQDGGGTETDAGGSTDPSGASCTDKYDCPRGQICKSNACANPTGSCPLGDAQCPAGQICGPSQTCITGCLGNQDCEASTDGPICDSVADPKTFKCGKCHPIENPCPSNQSCIDERCMASIQCTINDDCPSGLICNAAKVCQNCTGSAECGDGKTCVDGHCTGSAGCDADTDCDANFGYTSYCDANGVCQIGQCRDNSHCNTATGETCDKPTHTCVGGGSTTDGGAPTSNTFGPPGMCFYDDDSLCPAGYKCRASAGSTCTLSCSTANSCGCPAGYGCFDSFAYSWLGVEIVCGVDQACPSPTSSTDCYCLPPL